MVCWNWLVDDWTQRLRRRWQKWHQLAWFERRLLLQALFLLPVVALALRWFAFKRVYGILSRPLSMSVTNNHDKRLQQALSTANMVQAAIYVMPFPITCLPRSLTLWSLLNRQGLAGELQIGVQQANGEFAAHAWVEYEGVILNDGEDIHSRFAPLEKNI